MIKICLLLLSLSLFARENPFFPIDSSLDIPLSDRQLQKAPMLKRAALTLPSTAREIESVTVKYKNLDGSFATKTIELQNSVDWHLPIFISQNYNASCSKPTTVVQKPKKAVKFKKFAAFHFITFYTKNRVMKIETKDKLLHSFLLVRPHRIVCDFKRVTDFGRYVIKAKSANVFKKITLGTHSGYYRAVLELDGAYRYTIKKDADGYLISLH